MNNPDFLAYYDLEDYLFRTVHGSFKANGMLSAFDFFSIVAWKSNRGKGYVARRLRHFSGTSDLNEAVGILTRSIDEAPDARERVYIITEKWRIRLPTASAVLSVMYPDTFSVFDVRVCEQLEISNSIPDRTFMNRFAGYMEYIESVRHAVPDVKLRDKDRYLWAKSVAEQLHQDIRDGFT